MPIHDSSLGPCGDIDDTSRDSRPGTFDARRVGLDHLAFRVTDRDELENWVARLAVHNVAHTGIIDTGYGPTVVFRDPDNMQLELYVHQDGAEMTHPSDADSPEAQAILREVT
jgi:catechol-2,3-dioxygenase